MTFTIAVDKRLVSRSQLGRTATDLWLTAIALTAAGALSLAIVVSQLKGTAWPILVFLVSMILNLVTLWALLSGVIGLAMEKAVVIDRRAGVWITTARTRGFAVMLLLAVVVFGSATELLFWALDKANPHALSGHLGLLASSIAAGFPFGYGLTFGLLGLKVRNGEIENGTFAWDSRTYWRGGRTWDAIVRIAS